MSPEPRAPDASSGTMPGADEIDRQERETDLSAQDLVFERALRSLGRVEPMSLREFLG